jgi:tetratricopeptide (TPR) repeat protein
LAEQAKILVAEAEENNLDLKVQNQRWARWYSCSLCEQRYHGVVRCALGWACWKTYVGRAETDEARVMAMTQLGNGLSQANQNEDALSVREAQLAMKRRLGASEGDMLLVQSNLAVTYEELGRSEEALRMKRDVYSGYVRLRGEENRDTCQVAENYALALIHLKRFEEAKSLLRKTIPVVRRVLGDNDGLTLRVRGVYAQALYFDAEATLDDLREAVTTLGEIERTARRVLGGAHPTTSKVERNLRAAQALLATSEAEALPAVQDAARVTDNKN